MTAEIKLISVKDIMQIYGVGRALADRYAQECGLALPRIKNGPYKIPAKAFDEWINSRKDA